MRPIALALLTFCLTVVATVAVDGTARRADAAPASPPPSSSAPRVTLFVAPGFPAVDAPLPDAEALIRALAGCATRLVDADSLAAALVPGRTDLLVTPYGSAFPVDAWPALRGYLAAGGNWLNLGGAPLAVPVARVGDGWRAQARTVGYHRQIGIVQAEPARPRARKGEPADRVVHALTVRLGGEARRPAEEGSDGPREARLTPLAPGEPGDGLPSPCVRIDRLAGPFAGGCWIFVTDSAPLPPTLPLALLARQAAAGAVELTVRAERAVLRPGEPARLAVTLRRPGRAVAGGGAAPAGAVNLELRDPARDRRLGRVAIALTARGDSATATVGWPRGWPTPLPAGLYEIVADAAAPDGAGRLAARAGVAVIAAGEVAGGPALAVDGATFTLDGAPLPVTGTTYMDSETHRRFLLEPDPAGWERDFAAMQAAGVNLVRTGIWTGWDEHCAPNSPEPREEVLRALEAFLLTARAHGMPVIFTFFAFTPPAWGAANPYLDPAAVAAQQRFVSAFARRFAGARDIAWDLINEPSFSSPDHLWQCRPHGDAAEQAAWGAWLRRLAAADAGAAAAAGAAGAAAPGTPAAADAADAANAALARRLEARWGVCAADPLALPAPGDFDDRNLFGAACPRKAADYRRFAQEAFAGWARALRAAVRTAGGGAQLVTVGQDEGGARERPGPLFFGADVDFTCNHTWWLNDDLLWDGLFARLPDRPLLIEETGLMTYERPDGSAWRTAAQARELLARKLALAFAAGGAGSVQWCWNANVLMPSDNEAGIGFLRADGTARPELAAFTAIADFARRNAGAFRGVEPEEVVVVVPQSQLLSARDLATAATQRAVRVLEYDLGLPVRAVSEQAAASLTDTPRLIVLPSPRLLRQDAWDGLLRAVARGAVLCVSGPLDRDECERPVDRSGALGVPASARPVAPWEEIELDGRVARAGFRGGRLERVETAVIEGEAAAVRVLEHGNGTIVWSPVPVELAESPLATVALYVAAASRARLEPPLAREELDPSLLVRPVVFRDAVLVCIVNESAREQTARFRLRGVRAGGTGGGAQDAHGVDLARVAQPVAPLSAVLLLLDRHTGHVVDRGTDLTAE